MNDKEKLEMFNAIVSNNANRKQQMYNNIIKNNEIYIAQQKQLQEQQRLEEERKRQQEEEHKKKSQQLKQQASKISELSKQNSSGSYEENRKKEILNLPTKYKGTNLNTENINKVIKNHEQNVEQKKYENATQPQKEIILPDGRVWKTNNSKAIKLPDGNIWYTNVNDYEKDESLSGRLWRNVQSIGSSLYNGPESGVANVIDDSINSTKWIDKKYNESGVLGKIAMAVVDPGVVSRSVSNKLYSDNIKEKEQNKISEIQDTLKFVKEKNEEENIENVENATNKVTKKIAELAPSIGNTLMGTGLSAINPALGMTYFTGSASGSYHDEAISRGMNEDQAFAYSKIMGGLEGVTEQLIAGQNIKGFKGILEGKGFKNAVKSFGIEIGENFLQEAVMEPLSEGTTFLTAGKEYMKYDLSTSKGRNELLKASLSSGVDGALSAILTGGTSRGVASAVKVTNKLVNGQTPTQQEIIQAIQDSANAGVDVQGELQKSLLQSAEKQIIQTQDESDVSSIEQNPTQTQNNVQNLQQNAVKNQSNVQQQQISQIDNKMSLNQNVERQNNYIASAQKYNINTNTQSVRKIGELANKRGINIIYDDSLFKNNPNANAIYQTTTDKDGNVTRNIILNPNMNTNRTLEQIELHEIVHDMYGTEKFNKLKEMVLAYDKSKAGYQEARAELEQLYSQVYDKNSADFQNLIDEEAVADILGNRLGDQEFVNSLVNMKESRSIARKIYDWVVEKLNNMTRSFENMNQYFYWKDVKNKFEEAFRQEYKGNNNSIMYSIETDSNGRKYIKVDTDQNIFEGIEPKDYTQIAKMYMQDYLKGETKLGEDATTRIGNKGISKYTNPKQQTKYINEKMQLTPELKNVLQIAEKVKSGLPTKDTSKYPSWEYYKFNFELGGKTFEGLINIGIDKNGNKHFYEINKIHTTSNSYVSTSKSSSTDFINNSVAQNEQNVNNDTTAQYSMQESENNSGSFNLPKNHKQHQLEIIKKHNPMNDDYHTGIRSIEDIKTLEETLKDNDWADYDEFNPDLTKQDINTAIEKGKITVYSSYPIEQGIFISPSKMEAETYSENGKVYSKEVNIEDVAWIDPTQGQYARVENIKEETKLNLPKTDNQGKILTKEQQEYFKDSKVRDENGNLVKVYHGTNKAGFTEFKRNVNFFTDNAEVAKTYTGNDGIYEGYVNITNPITVDAHGEIWSKIDVDNIVIDGIDNVREFLNNYGASTWKEEGKLRTSTADLVSAIEEAVDEGSLVSDGVIIKNIYDEGGYSDSVGGKLGTDYVTFNSNQFKDTDNTNPTTNPDIRYSTNSTNTWQQRLDTLYKNNNKGTKLQDIKLPTKENMQQNKAEYPVTKESTLKIAINDALSNKNPKGAILLGKVKSNVATKIKNILGIDVNNRVHSLAKTDIRHMMAQHENQQVEDTKGQIAITQEDILKIPDIINNPDDIIRGTDNKNGKTVRYIKHYEDSTSFVVEVVPEKSGRMNIKTMWKKPTALTNSQTTPDSTSKTTDSSVSSTSNNIITQKTSNMQEQQNVNLPPPKNKTLNPTEIANLKQEDANTTVKLPQKESKQGNRVSNFFGNVTQDAQFLNEDLRKQISQDDGVIYYQGVTNEQTLNQAFKELQDGGSKATLEWFNQDSKKATAKDTAKGWILLKQYQDAGDYQSAVEVAKKMREIGTNAGQTVQAFNILSRLTPEGMVYYAQSELSEAYEAMVKNKSKDWIDKNASNFDLTPQETQFIMNTMEEVGKMEDGYDKKVKLAEIQKIITDKIPPTKGQSIKAWMRISMLFNPKTQVRNIAGNATILPVNMFSDLMSTTIDKAISKKTGVRTTGMTNIAKYGKGFGKGLYESYNDFRKGINTRNIQGNRFEVKEGRSFKNKGLGKALNKVDNMLSFMLDAGDRGFYEATFTNSINNQLVLNKTTEVTQDMIDIATNEALQRTWQDNNEYTKAVLQIRKILNKFGTKSYGLGDVLIPFAKTPANLTKAIIDYSPVGLAKTITRDAMVFNRSLSNGQYSPQLQHKFVQNLGKGMAGTALYVLGYALAKAGIASGEPDDDKDVKNFMKNSLGISSYSIKIGDKSFTFDWAQPVATPLAIMTNYVKYSEDNPDAKAIEKALQSINIGTEQLLQQSFMESLNTVLNGNGTFVENLSQAVLDLPARAIPTFSKQIADMVDGTQRTTFEYKQPLQSAVNSVKAKIPGLSKTLPASVDTLGNEIQKYGGENNVFNVFFNPANVNKGELSKAGEEIYNIYQETGNASVFPRTAPYYMNSDGEKINMTAETRAEFQKVSGKYVENSIEKLLDNKTYKNLSDSEKAEIIEEIISDSYNKAKYEVLDIENESYSKTRQLIEKVGVADYYDYTIKTSDIEGSGAEKKKIKVLAESKYSNKHKEAIYEAKMGSDDELYSIMKETGINITEYLNYKTQEFSADKKDDGTVDGKSISGSKKKKVYAYVNNMKITGNQRLLLLGTQYKLTNSERQALAQYVKSLNITNKEKLAIYDKLQGFTVYKDGRVTF